MTEADKKSLAHFRMLTSAAYAVRHAKITAAHIEYEAAVRLAQLITGQPPVIRLPAGRARGLDPLTVGDQIYAQHGPAKRGAKSARPVITPHGEFGSAAEAARALHITRAGVSNLALRRSPGWRYKDDTSPQPPPRRPGRPRKQT